MYKLETGAQFALSLPSGRAEVGRSKVKMDVSSLIRSTLDSVRGMKWSGESFRSIVVGVKV